MRWLRLRPEKLEELDQVDSRGRWIETDDDYDDDDDEDEEEGQMEDFDPDHVLDEDGEDEEEEDEEEDGSPPNEVGMAISPTMGGGPRGSRRGARQPTSDKATIATGPLPSSDTSPPSVDATSTKHERSEIMLSRLAQDKWAGLMVPGRTLAVEHNMCATLVQ